jgi:hypothetical protein
LASVLLERETIRAAGDTGIDADFGSETPQKKHGPARLDEEIAEDLYVGEAFGVLTDMRLKTSVGQPHVAGQASSGI